MAGSVNFYGVPDNKLRVKRCYYTGSDDLEVGQLLCYDSDTTTNISYWDSENETVDNTTSEGYQNEGKYNRVEKPKTDNVLWFAGVVSQPRSGEGYVDLWEPNGAIMPVKSSIDNYEGETVLYIQAGDYEAQTGFYTNGSETVPFALAMEDVDRSSTEGLCLAAVFHPMTFSFNCTGVSANEPLRFGDGITTGDVIPSRWIFDSYQTGGTFNAGRFRACVQGDGGGLGGISGAWRFEGVIDNTSQGGSYQIGLGSHLIFKSEATASAAYFHAACFKVENQDTTPATIASATWIAPLRCELQLNTNDAANKISQMYFCNQGDVDPDFWFKAESTDAIAWVDTYSDTPDRAIKINVAGTTYYIACSTATS